MGLYEDAIEMEAAAEAEAAASIETEVNDAPGVRLAMPDLSFLAAQTGEGAVEEYLEHPLNFDHTKSTARILRGCTGLCGQLDYALIDIALGIIEKLRGKENGEAINRGE